MIVLMCIQAFFMFNSVPLYIFIIRSGLVRSYKLSFLAFWRICGQKMYYNANYN